MAAKGKNTENQGVPAPWAKPEEKAAEPAVNEGQTVVSAEGEPSEAGEKATNVATTLDTPVVTAPEAPTPEAPAIEGEVVEYVTVTVPKAFKLRVDHFRELQFRAGVQQMEKSLAEHWYSKANGVEIYDASKQ